VWTRGGVAIKLEECCDAVNFGRFMIGTYQVIGGFFVSFMMAYDCIDGFLNIALLYCACLVWDFMRAISCIYFYNCETEARERIADIMTRT